MKEWFVKLDGRDVGPLSKEELRCNPKITPDTLIWKEGFTKWVPIRAVAELADLFQDEEKQPDQQESGDGKKFESPLGDATLALQRDPPHFIFWLLMILLLVIYILNHLGSFE